MQMASNSLDSFWHISLCTEIVFLLLFTNILLTANSHVWRYDNHTIQVAVFAPVNRSLPFSLDKVVPFVTLAESKLSDHLHPSVNIRFRFMNSRYPEETPVEIEAIKFLFKESNNTHAIIGPINDIALSHVARIAAWQGVPVISPGGMSIHFGVNKTIHPKYKSFIRMQYNLNALTHFLLRLFYYPQFGFKKIKVIAEKHDTLLDSCNHFHGAVDYIFNNFRKKSNNKFMFDNYLLPRDFDITHMFVSEISTDYAGKFNH